MIAEPDLTEESGSKRGKSSGKNPRKPCESSKKKMARCHEGSMNLSQEPQASRRKLADFVPATRGTRSWDGTAGTHARGLWKVDEKGRRRPAAGTGNLRGSGWGEPNAEAPPASALIGKEISRLAARKRIIHGAPCLFLAPSSSSSLLAASARYHTHLE